MQRNPRPRADADRRLEGSAILDTVEVPGDTSRTQARTQSVTNIPGVTRSPKISRRAAKRST